MANRGCSTSKWAVTQQYIYFAGSFEKAWHSRLRIGRFYVVIIVGLVSAFVFLLGNLIEYNSNKIDYIWVARLLGGLLALLGGAWRLSLRYWSQAQAGRLAVIKAMERTYGHLFCLYHSEDAQYEPDNIPYEGLVRIERKLAWISFAAGLVLLCLAHKTLPIFIK